MRAKNENFRTSKKMEKPETSKYWLDEVKERYSLTSYAKVAELLKLSKAAISQLTTGKTHVGIQTAIKIGKLLDTDPLLIVSSVLSLVESEDREFWQQIFQEKSSEKR
jgi:plasmid maintenance system antidote protein VapI